VKECIAKERDLSALGSLQIKDALW